MEMTDLEILSSYRQAKKKKEQITILSQLNACSKEKIIEILKNNGISGKELPRNRKKKTDIPKVEVPTKVKPVAEPKPADEVKQDSDEYGTIETMVDNLSSIISNIDEDVKKKNQAMEKLYKASELLLEASKLV